MSDEKPLPKHLYKYRTWSNPLHKRIITHNEIYFASPRWFNDPFDCRVPLEYRKLTRDKLIQTLQGLFQDFGTREEQLNSQALAEKQADWFIGSTNTEYEEFVLRRQRIHDAMTGVFSTSIECSNMLMWSHYSDSHKGICVEFDQRNLVRQLASIPRKNGFRILPYPVEYRDMSPAMLPLPDANNNVWHKQKTTKSPEWSHERELRFIDFGKTEFLVPLETGIITKVILGCEMPNSDQDEIKHELLKKGGDIALAKAVKKKDEFGLKIVPVEY